MGPGLQTQLGQEPRACVLVGGSVALLLLSPAVVGDRRGGTSEAPLSPGRVLGVGGVRLGIALLPTRNVVLLTVHEKHLPRARGYPVGESVCGPLGWDLLHDLLTGHFVKPDRKHEWEKHGTCVAQLDALDSQKKYFGKGLELYKGLALNR